MDRYKNVLLDLRKPMEQYTSLLLLHFGAVRIAKDGEEPFTYTSGNKGPIYVNCRVLVSTAEHRKVLAGFLMNLIRCYRGADDFVAGGATAGMPFAQDVADLLGKPYFYIKKAGEADHGAKQRVVGNHDLLVGKGILVEDLITDGKSKVSFVKALRDAGVECDRCLTIFDREQGGWKRLQDIKVDLHSLTTLRRTLDTARTKHIIDQATFNAVRQYLDHPKAWSDARGYAYK